MGDQTKVKIKTDANKNEIGTVHLCVVKIKEYFDGLVKAKATAKGVKNLTTEAIAKIVEQEFTTEEQKAKKAADYLSAILGAEPGVAELNACSANMWIE